MTTIDNTATQYNYADQTTSLNSVQSADASDVSEFESLMETDDTTTDATTEVEPMDMVEYIVKNIVDKSFDPAGDFLKDMIDEIKEG